MIKNPHNKKAYSEEYDADAIEELAKMAFYDICIEEGCNIPKGQKTVPDGHFSDLSCIIWEILKRTIRDGMELQKSIGT